MALISLKIFIWSQDMHYGFVFCWPLKTSSISYKQCPYSVISNNICTYSTIYKVCLQVTILNMKLINPFSWDCYTYIYLYLTTTNLHIKISCTMLVYIPFWCSFMEHIKHNKFCSADDIISAKSLIYDINKKRFVEFLLDLSVWNST